MKTLIKNAEIVTMTGEKYKNGCILFDEKIQYVGEDKAFEADNCRNWQLSRPAGAGYDRESRRSRTD